MSTIPPFKLAHAAKARAGYLDDGAEKTAIHQTYTAALIKMQIAKALATSPPLTTDQVSELSTLLMDGGVKE